MNQLLDDIPYGVIVCTYDGGMLYANEAASNFLNCKPNSKCNILSFIDDAFTTRVKELLETVKSNPNPSSTTFAYTRLKSNNERYFKIIAKKSKDDENHAVLIVYDYTTVKIQQDILIKSRDEINDNLIRNSLVLKAISDICKNILFKDRSNLSEIVVKLAYAFHLRKAAVCFKNGTGHVIFARQKEDNTYETGKLDGDQVKKDCLIWQNEVNFLESKQLIFDVPCSITCCDLAHQHNLQVHILKLKLDTQKVIGFFEFVEDEQFKLSSAQLEILESLSQLLAYVVNKKEQVSETTNYIKEKFKALTRTI